MVMEFTFALEFTFSSQPRYLPEKIWLLFTPRQEAVWCEQKRKKTPYHMCFE